MPFFVYILRSQADGRYYCGQTSDLDRRLRQHNDPEYSVSKTTKRFQGPWEMVWSRELESRSEAMKMEKAIKGRGISRFLTKAQLVESRLRRD